MKAILRWVVLGVIAVPQTAAAETRTVVSVPVLSIGAGGLTLQAERYLTRRWSVAVSLGGRRAAEGDFSSLSTGVGVEARLYWKGRARGTGPYLAARLAAGHTSVEDVMGGPVGATTSIAESVMIGWRWRIRSVEITPAIGWTV